MLSNKNSASAVRYAEILTLSLKKPTDLELTHFSLIMLPSWYLTLGLTDPICEWSKTCSEHLGNLLFVVIYGRKDLKLSKKVGHNSAGIAGGQQRSKKTWFHLIPFVTTVIHISFLLLCLNVTTTQRFLKQLPSQEFPLTPKQVTVSQEFSFWVGRENTPQALPESNINFSCHVLEVVNGTVHLRKCRLFY